MVLSPITACVVDGKSTLFIVDDEETVRTYTASDEKEKTKGRTNYTDAVLKVGGKNVQSQVKDMVALSYPLGDGTLRSRLYYADQNRILQRLEKDGSSDWTQSGIGDLRAQVADSSSLSALVSA